MPEDEIPTVATAGHGGDPSPDGSSGGAQGLERGLRVLRDIATSGPWGRRLIDIQMGTGLNEVDGAPYRANLGAA